MANENPNPEFYDDTQAAGAGQPASYPAVQPPAAPYRQRRRKVLGVGLVLVGLLMIPRAVFGGFDHDDWESQMEMRGGHWGPRFEAPQPVNRYDRDQADIERQIEDLEQQREDAQNNIERQIEELQDQREGEQENLEREIEDLQEQITREQEDIERQIEDLQR